MLKNKYFIFLLYVGVVLNILVFSLSTYAYLTVNRENEEEKPIKINTYNKDIKITYVDTSNVSMVNAYTGEKIVKTFFVENVSDGIAYYDIVLENLVNDFVNKNDLVYTLKSNSNGAIVNENVLPSEDTVLASKIKIDKNEKQSYELVINFLKTEEDQSENMNKTFSSNIRIISSKGINSGEKIYKEDTLGNKILSEKIYNIESDEYKNLVDGVYITNNSIDGVSTYFYRGSNKLLNNVVVGNYCYKIIRTTEDYGIKLIYSGKYENNICDNSGVVDTKIQFNKEGNYNAYVGYMFGNVSSDNYEAEHKNISSSDLKSYLDVWYNTNIKDYESIIDNNAIYCNDRTTSKFKYGNVIYDVLGYSNNNTGYKLMNDYFINKSNNISYNCNINDRFTVDNELGNKKLNHSIGTISIDELYYSGFLVNDNKNNNHFLYTKNNYWTMTPAYYNGQFAYNFIVSGNKVGFSKVLDMNYIRPVITVKKDTKVLSGSGSITEPYILTEVKTNESDDVE